MSESEKWKALCDANCEQKSVFPNCLFCDIALEYRNALAEEPKEELT